MVSSVIKGCKFFKNLIFLEIFRKFPDTLAKARNYNVYRPNFHSSSLIFLGAVLKQVFLKIVHTVKAYRSQQLFVKNMLILQHHFAMLDLETADLHR